MTQTVNTAPDTWVGSIVLSLAGRDRKRLFVIVSVDEVNGYVYIRVRMIRACSAAMSRSPVVGSSPR